MLVVQEKKKIGKKQKNIIIWLNRMHQIILKLFFTVRMEKQNLHYF